MAAPNTNSTPTRALAPVISTKALLSSSMSSSISWLTALPAVLASVAINGLFLALLYFIPPTQVAADNNKAAAGKEKEEDKDDSDANMAEERKEDKKEAVDEAKFVNSAPPQINNPDDVLKQIEDVKEFPPEEKKMDEDKKPEMEIVKDVIDEKKKDITTDDEKIGPTVNGPISTGGFADGKDVDISKSILGKEGFAGPGGGGFDSPGLAVGEGLIGKTGGVGDAKLGFGGDPGAGEVMKLYGRGGGVGGRGVSNDAKKRLGATTESEAAVSGGLQWILLQQHEDGRWGLEGPYPDAGQANDIAGTAFGLLPLLGAGKTHKMAGKVGDNKRYGDAVLKGLLYLIRKQDKRTGDLGGGMYAHGLAAIALCEAYAMTQDKALLQRPAQMAINYILYAQHDRGGWRYGPKQAGDTSVVGWQIMALKSAQMANLNVPEKNLKLAINYLNEQMNDSNYGYGYVGKGATHTMTAVGLLCRQYIENWGPNNKKLRDPVKTFILSHKPGSEKNLYFFYYATQVLHHFGGKDWDDWNVLMRDHLIKEQEKGKPVRGGKGGSWSPVGEAFASAGGRLMQTSLSLLSLEVYYRHLPLYYNSMSDTKLSSK